MHKRLVTPSLGPGEGDDITSWGICCSILTHTLKDGCMVPPKLLVEGSDSLSTPGCSPKRHRFEFYLKTIIITKQRRFCPTETK